MRGNKKYYLGVDIGSVADSVRASLTAQPMYKRSLAGYRIGTPQNDRIIPFLVHQEMRHASRV